MDEIRFNDEEFENIIDELHKAEIYMDMCKEQISKCREQVDCETNKFEASMRGLMEKAKILSDNVRELKNKAENVKKTYAATEEQNVKAVEALYVKQNINRDVKSLHRIEIDRRDNVSHTGYKITVVSNNKILRLMTIHLMENWLVKRVLSDLRMVTLSKEYIRDIRNDISNNC